MTCHMLQFTKELDYGLQLLLGLMNLEKEELLSLRRFSKESGISFLFLQRIARKLRLAGIIAATKGAQGGYILKANPKALRLKEIVEALEGEYAITDCLKSNCSCPKLASCNTHKLFKVVDDDFKNYLKNHYLFDLITYAKVPIKIK